jgi:hypothetical protein
VHGIDGGASHTPGPRQVQTGLVKMDDIEVVGLPDDGFQAENFVGHRVLTVWIEAQRLLADRHQSCPRLRITAREQRDVVSELNKVFGQIRDHTFRPAIVPRRHCLL